MRTVRRLTASGQGCSPTPERASGLVLIRGQGFDPIEAGLDRTTDEVAVRERHEPDEELAEQTFSCPVPGQVDDGLATDGTGLMVAVTVFPGIAKLLSPAAFRQPCRAPTSRIVRGPISVRDIPLRTSADISPTSYTAYMGRGSPGHRSGRRSLKSISASQTTSGEAPVRRSNAKCATVGTRILAARWRGAP